MNPNVVTSLEALITEHRAFVRASLRCLRVAPGSIDDAEQEVFLVVLRRHGTFDPSRGTSYRGWLWGICRNVAASQRRSARRFARHEAPERVEHPPMDERLDANHALAALDDQSRALWLARCEGRSAKELARRLELPMTTVQWRLRQAKRVIVSTLRETKRHANAVIGWMLRPQRGLAPVLPIMLGVALGGPTAAPAPAPKPLPESARALAAPAALPALHVRPQRRSSTPHGIVRDEEPVVRYPAKRSRPRPAVGRVSLGEPTLRPPRE